MGVVSAKGCPGGAGPASAGQREKRKKRADGYTRLARLMDSHCRHFFKRFRTTFECRRASHFSKSPVPSVGPDRKIAIDSARANGSELSVSGLSRCQPGSIRSIVESASRRP
ncbi:hypothetical protein K0M31_020257 [Melipona bicolor]|uniref:Uncharacterized protein n=1 Tax=Melipona bicolor TaxID=60889 RepID=A0AA40G1R8_9HYME|nr:hypothetical protein K0M31_020257 [Melipona bicolor]